MAAHSRQVLVLLLASTLCAQPFSAADDKRVEAEIQSRLAKSVIAQDRFTVRVQGGVAYWDGQTAVPQRKGAATRMAKSAGARRVVNRIRVVAAAAKPTPVAPKAKAPPPPPAPPKRPQVQWRERK